VKFSGGGGVGKFDGEGATRIGGIKNRNRGEKKTDPCGVEIARGGYTGEYREGSCIRLKKEYEFPARETARQKKGRGLRKEELPIAIQSRLREGFKISAQEDDCWEHERTH